jgi:Raf kinase inhibitor-like YbhB/YbcL family protein
MIPVKLAVASALALAALGVIHHFTRTTMDISSPDFTAGGMIPTRFSCKGASTSPRLHISGYPATTKSLAIICHDPDAPKSGGFTHWVVWNIDPAPDIPAGFTGGEQGLNGDGKTGYTGPCPPSGTHHYHFYVYALDTRLVLHKSSSKAELEKGMEGHILANGDLVGLFAAGN